ncbi:SRPBCC family protein [Rhodococcus triatomae]|uniref:Polyketide cyclase / dehydrase and lipid transport n=1 Tax=Rhodococcus triatomae TaxID=300028 RepID=A0A1G8LCE6_9NOCA|nr:SRPBCC family protein [Rhodococcus triatomae]QNG20559.1 SRPBCC family protein [Rhodococcus triatomae]QNG23523.1 SRPBCC family protein [Rhodococcus triatomae]SDI53351.1 Polyketide cyclase / dehydrase and lipid transport [Rhodococcus triatomae]
MALEFDMTPVGSDFFDSAPMRWRYSIDVAAPAESVWAGLTTQRPLSWCRLLTDVEYTTSGPYGIGTTRTAVLAHGAMRMNEQFFRWDEENTRHSFFVTGSNVPLFSAFAEDYLIQSTPTGSRLVWTFALAPRRGFGVAARLGSPVNKFVFTTFVRDTRTHFGTPKGAGDQTRSYP